MYCWIIADLPNFKSFVAYYFIEERPVAIDIPLPRLVSSPGLINQYP